MALTKNEKKKSIFEIILILLIVIYPLLLIWQGLDFTDTGFHLTDYQNIFLHPHSVQYSFMYWLSDIIGGVWMYVFGWLGIVGVRLAGVIVILFTIYFCYNALKDHFPRKYLLLALLAVLMFTFNTPRLLEYNTLTALFYAAAFYLLGTGITRNRKHFIFIGGLILGLNIFLRLPNVLGFSLIVGIPFYGFINKTSLREQLRQSAYFISGFIAAVIFAFAFMKLIGHYQYFINSISLVSQMGESSSSTHGVKHLIDLLIGDFRLMLKHILNIGVVSVIILAASFLIGNRMIKMLKIPACAAAVLYYGHLFLAGNYYKNLIYDVNGIMYIVLLAYIFNIIKAEKELRLLALMALLILFETPLGSDNGMYNSIYSMWASGALVFSGILSISDFAVSAKKGPGLKLSREKLDLLRLLGISLLITFSVIQGYKYTYRDSSSRLSMRYSVNSSLLTGVLTTKARAAAVNGLLAQTPKYIHKGDYLLAYNDIPMIYYLTGTTPYLYNSWPRLYNPKQFETAFNQSLAEDGKPAAVIIQKMETTSTSWPGTYNISYIDKMNADTRYQLVQRFMDTNYYKMVWENNLFEIWTYSK